MFQSDYSMNGQRWRYLIVAVLFAVAQIEAAWHSPYDDRSGAADDSICVLCAGLAHVHAAITPAPISVQPHAEVLPVVFNVPFPPLDYDTQVKQPSQRGPPLV